MSERAEHVGEVNGAGWRHFLIFLINYSFVKRLLRRGHGRRLFTSGILTFDLQAGCGELRVKDLEQSTTAERRGSC
jgi:hypothetical protein